MFKYNEIPAIGMRIMLFIQLSLAYPLVNAFQRSLLMTLFMPECKTVHDIPRNKFIAMNVGISIIPLASAIFYP